MKYYIQGSPARAKEIKAAFERLGIRADGYDFSRIDVLFFTFEAKGKTYMMSSLLGTGLDNIILTHPDYKELELPVEPFKVGDWVVKKAGNTFYGGNYAEQITLIEVDEKGKYIWLPSKTWVDADGIRLWTIADARDGDVLAADECYVIFKEIDGLNIKCYCTYHYMGFNPSFYIDTLQNKTAFHPATKEQRDLLFSKMKEAGYQWDSDKKELHKIINPKFKVGDNVKTGNTIETIAELDHATRRYYCESGRTIWFENQDLWHLAPKPHYDIANFHAGMPVLVRETSLNAWQYVLFSHCYMGGDGLTRFNAGLVGFTQCIPFEGNEHLLGTTDMPSEEYINW